MSAPKRTAKPKKPAKKPTKKPAKKPAKAPLGGEIVIRMYNVGFGDAFLVTVPGSPPRKLLVDCGSIASGGHAMPGVVQQIIADVTDAHGHARIDIVVATHRHRDHVSGFANHAAWSKVEVGEVWMPWTEDPANPRATEIREQQARLAMHLAAAFGPGAAAYDADLHEMAVNALANEAAMTTLHSGFAGKPLRRFLPVQKQAPLRTDVFPDATFQVVGPSFSEDVIRDMDPPAGQSYLVLADDANPGQLVVPEPFAAKWWAPTGPLTAAETAKIDDAADGLGEAALLALEQAVNGTSLFFILQFGGANLVFPGDAQWGTWKAVLARPEIVALFRDLHFYKIGHHGSHNATPVGFVDKVGKDFFAMASVHPVKKWPEIPRAPMLAALGKHTHKIARSDQLGKADKAFHVAADGAYAEARIPVNAD